MNRITRCPSYLIRNPHSYCFRMNAPQDIQPYVNKMELRWSLNTGYISAAKTRARALAVAVQDIFQTTRELIAMGALTDDEIRQIAHKHIPDLLKASEYLRTERFPRKTRDKLFPILKRHPARLAQSARRDLENCDYLNAFF